MIRLKWTSLECVVCVYVKYIIKLSLLRTEVNVVASTVGGYMHTHAHTYTYTCSRYQIFKMYVISSGVRNTPVASNWANNEAIWFLDFFFQFAIL